MFTLEQWIIGLGFVRLWNFENGDLLLTNGNWNSQTFDTLRRFDLESAKKRRWESSFSVSAKTLIPPISIEFMTSYMKKCGKFKFNSDLFRVIFHENLRSYLVILLIKTTKVRPAKISPRARRGQKIATLAGNSCIW